jgi:hypothetical protein
MRGSVPFLGLLAMLCGPAAICAAPDQSLLGADRLFVEALANPNTRALEQLLEPEFEWTSFDGKTETRSQVLRNLPKPAITNENDRDLKTYTYGVIGVVQTNLGKTHVLRVWVKRPEGWKALVHQELVSLDAPPSFTPSAASNCENPCRAIPYEPKNETERQVVIAYSKLETAAMARNSPVFATLVADEFVAASSNSNKIADKRGRMDDFDHSKTGGVAPTPLTSARMFDFTDVVVMTSEHQPVRGKPLHITRVWVKRDGHWMETLSYQTAIQGPVE